MVIKIRDTKSRQAIPVPIGSYSVGRDESNQIHISDSSVSRKHAIITNSQEGLFIEDLGSSNGTAVRGEFITSRTALKMGDMFFLGNVSFKVEPEVTGELVNPMLPKEDLAKPRLASKGISKIHIEGQLNDNPLPKGQNSPGKIESLETGLLKPVQAEAKTALASGATLKLPSPKSIEEKSLKKSLTPKPVPSISLPTTEEIEGGVFTQSPVYPAPVSPSVAPEQNLSGWKIACVLFFVIGIVIGLLLHHFFPVFP